MKIQAWGNSAAVRISAVLLNKLDMQIGQELTAVVVDNTLVLKPIKKPKYVLEELIAQCDTQAEHNANVTAWQDMVPTGREAW